MKKFSLYLLLFIGVVFYFWSSWAAFDIFTDSFTNGVWKSRWMMEAGLAVSYGVCMFFFLTIGACLNAGFSFVSKNKLKSFCFTVASICLSFIFFITVDHY